MRNKNESREAFEAECKKIGFETQMGGGVYKDSYLSTYTHHAHLIWQAAIQFAGRESGGADVLRIIDKTINCLNSPAIDIEDYVFDPVQTAVSNLTYLRGVIATQSPVNPVEGESVGVGEATPITKDWCLKMAAIDDGTAMAGTGGIPDALVKSMVDRFLSWKLPVDFHPGGGIEFDAYKYRKMDTRNPIHEPIGTNLFTATQAEVMVRHMLNGATQPPAKTVQGLGEDEAVEIMRDVGMQSDEYHRECYRALKAAGCVKNLPKYDTSIKEFQPVTPEDELPREYFAYGAGGVRGETIMGDEDREKPQYGSDALAIPSTSDEESMSDETIVEQSFEDERGHFWWRQCSATGCKYMAYRAGGKGMCHPHTYPGLRHKIMRLMRRILP